MKPSPSIRFFFVTGFVAASAFLGTVPVAAQTLTNAFGGLSESSNAPIDIESDTLTMYTDDYAVFSGNVKAVQGTTTLRAKELKVHYVGNGNGDSAGDGASTQPAAGGGVGQPASGSGAASPANEGGGAEQAASATSADGGAAGEDSAQHSVEDPINIESDWLLVHDKEKYAHFKGNVRVVRGDTKLRSRELTVNFTGGDSLSGAAETNDGGAMAAQITKIEARGDVRALLTPRQSTPAQSAEAPAATAPGSAAAHVRASSGEFADASSMTTGAMAQSTASNSAEPNPASASNAAVPQSATPAADQDRQITKLEATGDVVITSDNGETSTSDWAIYDMPSELVTIGGNVVLTQNETVLKGDRLIVDLRTGESRFENTGTAATGGRRIRALFMPKEDGAKSRAKPDKDNGSAEASPQMPETPVVDDTEPLPLVPEFR